MGKIKIGAARHIADENLPRTRQAAVALGLNQYITGRPCKNGHIARRYMKGGCAMCADVRHAEWRATNRAYLRTFQRKKNWARAGIKPDRDCSAACECCGAFPTRKALCADHDHTTGKFRGWLCDNCNIAIANLGDSLSGARRAIVYLEKFG